jgi:diacylglycerol kinase family enzyme
MRALLVVNPTATATSTRARDVLAGALATDLKVEVAVTRRRGHARELAAGAADDQLDLVVALGGDGTVNEVVNGLLRRGPAPDVPALAVVPGGSTNVFARALGLPRSPVEATGEILRALREGRSRRIGLGAADSRYFTFCAGVGLDAAVVRRVERRRCAGARATPGLYVRSGLNRFFLGTDRRQPRLRVNAPGWETPVPVFLGLVCNTSPWTYLGARPVVPCPDASFDTGLDLLALRKLGTGTALRHLRQILSRRPDPHGRHLVRLHDQPEFTLTTDVPLPLQVDGEALADVRAVRFRSVPRALRVIG